MIILSLLVYALLVLIFPDSLVTHYGDIPLLALLLSQKRITLARWGTFLCLLNTSLGLHAFLGVGMLVRLLSVDLCHLLLKNVYASLFLRASLATVLLVLLDWLFSCFLLPTLFPSFFYEIPLWDTKLVLFSTSLLLVLTCALFLISMMVKRGRLKKEEA